MIRIDQMLVHVVTENNFVKLLFPEKKYSLWIIRIYPLKMERMHGSQASPWSMQLGH